MVKPYHPDDLLHLYVGVAGRHHEAVVVEGDVAAELTAVPAGGTQRQPRSGVGARLAPSPLRRHLQPRQPGLLQAQGSATSAGKA